MKTRQILLGAAVVAVAAVIALANNVVTWTFTTPTTVTASSATNLTGNAGAILNNSQQVGPDRARIFVSFVGVSNGPVIFYYSSSPDGVNFETATNSNIKVTVQGAAGPCSGGNQFVVSGIHTLKLAWIDNTASGGIISNLLSNITITPVNGGR